MATTKEMLRLLLPAMSQEEQERRNEAVKEGGKKLWGDVKATPGMILDLLKSIPGAIEKASWDISDPGNSSLLAPITLGVRYAGSTPEGRQDMLDTGATVAGGTVGGGLGSLAGPFAPAAAPAGAAAGSGAGLYASRVLGPLLGASGQQGEAEDFITDAIRTGGQDAMFEGIPMMIAGGKNLAKSGVRRMIAPKSETQKAVNALIEANPGLNESMPLWARSDRPAARILTAVLNNAPTSAWITRDADRKALEGLQKYLQSIAEGKASIPQGINTLDELVEVAQKHVREQTGELAQSIRGSLDLIPQVDPTTGGTMLREGFDQAERTVSGVGNQAYGPVLSAYGDATVDLTPAAMRAWAELDKYAPELTKMFRRKATKPLQDAASAMGPRTFVDEVTGETYTLPTTVTFNEWHKLKTELNKQISDIAEQRGIDVKNLYAIRDSINDAAERALPPDAIASYRDADRLYAEVVQNVRRPNPVHRNNPVVPRLMKDSGVDNEAVLKSISSPEDLANFERATSRYGLTPGTKRLEGPGGGAPPSAPSAGGPGQPQAGGFSADVTPQLGAANQLPAPPEQPGRRRIAGNLPSEDVDYNRGFSADIPPQLEGDVASPPPGAGGGFGAGAPPPPAAPSAPGAQRQPIPPPFSRDVTREPFELRDQIRGAVTRDKFITPSLVDAAPSGEALPVSPEKLRSRMLRNPPLVRATGYVPEMADIASRANVEQEKLLTKGLFGEQIFDPGIDRRLLPGRMANSPAQHDISSRVLEGDTGVLNRAYLEERLRESLHPDLRISGADYHVNPTALEGQLQKTHADMMPKVLGDDYGKWKTGVEAGKALRAPQHMFGNPSGTAMTSAALGSILQLGGAATSMAAGDNATEKFGVAAALLGIPYYLANRGINPRVIRDYTGRSNLFGNLARPKQALGLRAIGRTNQEWQEAPQLAPQEPRPLPPGALEDIPPPPQGFFDDVPPPPPGFFN